MFYYESFHKKSNETDHLWSNQSKLKILLYQNLLDFLMNILPNISSSESYLFKTVYFSWKF